MWQIVRIRPKSQDAPSSSKLPSLSKKANEEKGGKQNKKKKVLDEQDLGQPPTKV